MKKFKDHLLESYKINTMDIPTILTMKRKDIKVFSDGSKVGLYHIDKLNIDIPIPFATKKK